MSVGPDPLSTVTPLRGQPVARPAWRLALAYFRSEERWGAILLLVVIVALTLGRVGLLVFLNNWNREFYEALQNKDYAAFGPLLIQFTVLAVVFIVGSVYRLYFTQMLEMRWRVWLTHRFIGAWLGDQAYYRIALNNRSTDNPDQRIAEDLRSFTTTTLGLSLGLLSSTVTLASFAFILFEVSGPLDVTLGGSAVTIPGYMLWVAILYALVGSMATRYIGRPLIGLNYQQERLEADFRFGLVRVRENAEGIALYSGERFERAALTSQFERIRANWWALMQYTKRLTFLTVGYAQVADIFPLLVAAPRYFSGAITLGQLTQIGNAFGQVQGSLSWFVDNYGALASWRASTERLLAFQHALEAASTLDRAPEHVAVDRNGSGTLQVENVELRVPDGRPIVSADFTVEPGDRVLLTGPNGSGKSTMFRAIAGIWPFGRGVIRLPENARTLFLPQRPYLPIGSLRASVSYPAEPTVFADDEIKAALRDVGLTQLVDRLDDVQNWSLLLSGGEQQRLAFARALLHKPDWLFLDEATAALDDAGERQVYDLLRERLPSTTVLNVAHRPALPGFHGTHLALAPHDGGPATLEATREVKV